MEIVYSICLLLIANGSPIIIRKIVAEHHFARPIDHGHCLADGQPVFGSHKTWRGLIAALFATSLLSPLLSLPMLLGFQFALLSMAGDLLSSFIKRRLHIRAGGRAFALDQIPEALFPLFVLREALQLDYGEIFISLILFILLEIVLSRILYKLHIRQQPY